MFARSGRIAAILGLAAVYAITALLGLLLDPVGGFATLVWAPTGIALAAVLLLGYHLWPGVFLGALVANVLTGAPPLAAAAIAAGNTLEAVFGVWGLRRIRNFQPSLERLRDVLAFMCIAVLAPIVSATIGVTSLGLAGTIASTQLAGAWRAWWVGDFIGALLVAPLVITWSAKRSQHFTRSQLSEMLAIAVTIILVGGIVFFGRTPLERTSFLQAYIMFPVLLWAAVRFEQRGATVAVVLASLIAIAGTAQGSGPFSRPELRQSLFVLQTFMGIVGASFLVLATALTERGRARDELRRALIAEAHANQAKLDFLAVVSHELRTPLNAIGGYAQMLTMQIPGPLTDQQRDAIARIKRNQEHLASLVDDVLGFVRLEAGELQLTAETVRVSEALDALESFVRPELRRKQIDLERLPFDQSLFIRADPDKLRQILVNFLSNAVKYTEAGGRIEIGAEGKNHRVRIFVRDNGVGIPADQLHRVFEPFFQIERGKTRRYPGVGLGLTISRDLARAMHGEVSIESQLGKGTMVSVELPAA